MGARKAEIRQKLIHVRLTDLEAATLRQQAEREGLRLSDLVRAKLFAGQATAQTGG